MKRLSSAGLRWVAASVAALIILAPMAAAPARVNAGTGVAPVKSHPHGRTYAEWAAAWWQWAVGIPVDENPITDPDGRFGLTDQSGSVYFLAGAFGGTAERSITIPTGKALFFPILNSLWWAPDDVDDATAYVEGVLGLDAADFTDEELVRMLAAAQVSGVESMSLLVDGRPVDNVLDYYFETDAFSLTDTDLIDSFGGEIGQPNTAFAAGYWVMLNPLPPGEHTITWSANQVNPVAGSFSLDITYHVTVRPGKR
jgi:hypothetical protein